MKIINPGPGLRGRQFILLLLCFMFSLHSWAQTINPVMEKLVKQLNSLSPDSTKEIIYLQTNKDIYETGEDLWFKAYVLESHYFIPSSASKTLYIQLISEKTGQSFWDEKYEIKNGFSGGHLMLPLNLTEGNYHVAAYTGNSFFNDSTALNSLCRIKVRKDMKSHLSVSSDFNRLIYRSKDSISVTFNVLYENGEIPPFAEIQAELRRGEKRLAQKKVTTDPNGQVTLVFLPQKSGEGLRIDLKIRCTVKEEPFSIPVPCVRESPIQFNVFPEGGNLVSAIQSNLAFKAVDYKGLPLDVEGTLFEDDKAIIDFKSVHAGMGSMVIIPYEDKKYTIRLTKPKTDSVFVLPKVYPEGVVMRLGKRNDKYLEIFVSQPPGHAKQNVYLRGQVRGVVYCMATAALDNELKFKIPLEKLPVQGIAEFTLFDENLVAVAERLVYTHPEKKLYIETKLSKEKYETREKGQLKISVKDEDGKPVIAHLGVSIFDKIFCDTDNPKNIFTYFYLTSQLMGKVYDPAYYYDDKNKGRDKALDLVLLTQGWRRYVWNEANLKTAENTKHLVFDYTDGELFHTKNKKVVPTMIESVKAYNPDSKSYADLIRLDATGNFNVEPLQLKKGQGGYVYLEPMSSENFGPKIRLTDPFQVINGIRLKKLTDYPFTRLQLVKKKEELIKLFVGNHSAIKLPEFVVKAEGNRIFREKYMGHLDSLAKMRTLDYVCMNNILNCPNHPPSDPKSTKPVEGKTYQTLVNSLTGGKRGAIKGTIVYHYPNYSEEELLKMFNLTKLKGYYPYKEFYQPNYDKVSGESQLADFRNTLLWDPSVITNEKGEATVEFFCSDINYGFVGKVEGVSGDGLLGNTEFEFTVKRPK